MVYSFSGLEVVLLIFVLLLLITICSHESEVLQSFLSNLYILGMALLHGDFVFICESVSSQITGAASGFDSFFHVFITLQLIV